MNGDAAEQQTARDDFHASVQLQMAELTSLLLQTRQESRACREMEEARSQKAAEQAKIEEEQRASEDTQYEEVHSMLSEVLADQHNQATPGGASREDEDNTAEQILQELGEVHRSQVEALKSLAREHRRMGKEHLRELHAELRLSAPSSTRSSRAS